MSIKIVNRKRLIGGKLFRFETMKGVNLVGYKVAIGIYEIRLYLKQTKPINKTNDTTTNNRNT